MFEKILVPLDGSVVSEGILPFIAQLAKGLKSSVVILSVCSPTKSGPAGLMIRGGLDKSDALIAEEIAAEALVAVGDPASEIRRVAQDEGCDLIAMSTHGRSGFRKGILHSVTYLVMLSSCLPTLVVAPGRV